MTGYHTPAWISPLSDTIGGGFYFLIELQSHIFLRVAAAKWNWGIYLQLGDEMTISHTYCCFVLQHIRGCWFLKVWKRKKKQEKFTAGAFPRIKKVFFRFLHLALNCTQNHISKLNPIGDGLGMKWLPAFAKVKISWNWAPDMFQ